MSTSIAAVVIVMIAGIVVIIMTLPSIIDKLSKFHIVRLHYRINALEARLDSWEEAKRLEDRRKMP